MTEELFVLHEKNNNWLFPWMVKMWLVVASMCLLMRTPKFPNFFFSFFLRLFICSKPIMDMYLIDISFSCLSFAPFQVCFKFAHQLYGNRRKKREWENGTKERQMGGPTNNPRCVNVFTKYVFNDLPFSPKFCLQVPDIIRILLDYILSSCLHGNSAGVTPVCK